MIFVSSPLILYMMKRIMSSFNFKPGKEADFIVLDYQATPLIDRRIKSTKTIEEKLFVLMMLGDDRAISATHISGDCIYTKA